MTTGSSNGANESADDDRLADHPYWRVGEEERHFNTIEAGVRGLASAWLLGTFAASAVILRRPAEEDPWLPGAWLVVIICVMGATGLALLWLIDQLVYHRLLNSAFVLCLKMERVDDRLPPLRHLMKLASGDIGMESLLRRFYTVPIGGLMVFALGVAAYHVAIEDPSFVPAVALAVVALLPAGLLELIRRRSPKNGLRQAAEAFGDPTFMDESQDVVTTFVRRLENAKGSP
jgi:hypothetical protein